jgi:hypothetical protein
LRPNFFFSGLTFSAGLAQEYVRDLATVEGLIDERINQSRIIERGITEKGISAGWLIEGSVIEGRDNRGIIQ